MQLTFPWHEPTAKPRRRQLWRAEMRRLTQLLADERQRDAARHEAEIGRLHLALDDIRSRVSDLERGEGAADLARAPVTRPQLRAFASR